MKGRQASELLAQGPARLRFLRRVAATCTAVWVLATGLLIGWTAEPWIETGAWSLTPRAFLAGVAAVVAFVLGTVAFLIAMAQLADDDDEDPVADAVEQRAQDEYPRDAPTQAIRTPREERPLCPHCGGVGDFLDGRECEACDGSGRDPECLCHAAVRT